LSTNKPSRKVIDIRPFVWRINAMTFHVARNGDIIGEFSEEDFRDRVFRGEVRADDYYWTEGMADWQPVAEYRAGARTQVIRRDLPRNDPLGHS
jgi:hypothetical protein